MDGHVGETGKWNTLREHDRTMTSFRWSFGRTLVMNLVITPVIVLVVWTGASMQSTQLA